MGRPDGGASKMAAPRRRSRLVGPCGRATVAFAGLGDPLGAIFDLHMSERSLLTRYSRGSPAERRARGGPGFGCGKRNGESAVSPIGLLKRRTPRPPSRVVIGDLAADSGLSLADRQVVCAFARIAPNDMAPVWQKRLTISWDWARLG